MASTEWDDPAARQAVFDAVERGDMVAVRDAVERGFPPTARSVHAHFTLVHKAINCGLECLVPLLLARGWDVDAASRCGDTPVHIACVESRLDMAKLLVEAGACLETVTIFGWTVAHNAAFARSYEVLDWLASRPEVDWFCATNDNKTALSILKNRGPDPEALRCVPVVYAAMAAQRKREARWSPLRAAFVNAVATAK